MAVSLLTDTEKGVQDVVNGLNDAQLMYKPAGDKSGVEGCLKHIAISEQMLWSVIEQSLKIPLILKKGRTFK